MNSEDTNKRPFFKASVPCNGCTLCCKKDAVRILEHEDPTQWHTEEHPFKKGALMLAHKKNGDCYYLIDGGCSIQNCKPQQCYEMDCRNISKAITYTQAKKMAKKGQLDFKVWKKGRDLIKKNN